jgi:DNA-binding LacI/PurR family transcriptional regulator
VARLIDVAKAAGVSRSTASNVFNNPELVRPKLRRRVETMARELGYAGPDPKGRLLRSGKTNAIGVTAPAGGWGVVDSLRNPSFRLFLLGVAEVCDKAGVDLLIMSDNSERGSGVRTALVDGFILSRIEHIDQVEPARLRRLPFAVVDVDAGPEFNSVWADARSGCRAAAKHLVDLGHRRFAIMSFMRDFTPAVYHAPAAKRDPSIAGMPLDQEKFHGYAEALAEAGIDIGQVPVVQAHPWDRDAARLLLDKAPEATAVLSMADMQAIAVMAEARLRGRDVPRDLSVIGYNDIPEAAKADPPLTTVDGMGIEKGRIAARMVLEAGSARRERLQPRLTIRASTAPAPR